MNYHESLSAVSPGWKSEAIQLMERGVEFVVVHYDETLEMRNDCIALAQEHDYRVVAGPEPHQVGFKKRDSLKRKESHA